MMDLQEPGVVAARHLALMAVPAQDLTPPGRRDGQAVGAAGLVDAGVALHAFKCLGGKSLGATVGQDLGRLAGRAVVDVDLNVGAF